MGKNVFKFLKMSFQTQLGSNRLKGLFILYVCVMAVSCAPVIPVGGVGNNQGQVNSKVATKNPSQDSNTIPIKADTKKTSDENEGEKSTSEEEEPLGEEFEGNSETPEVGDPPITEPLQR